MSVLDVGHQRKSLSLQSIAPLPQAGDVVGPNWAVSLERVVLHGLGRLEALLAPGPLADERGLGVGLAAVGGGRGGGRSAGRTRRRRLL